MSEINSTNKQGSKKIIIILVILILGGIILYFLFKKNTSNKDNKESEEGDKELTCGDLETEEECDEYEECNYILTTKKCTDIQDKDGTCISHKETLNDKELYYKFESYSDDSQWGMGVWKPKESEIIKFSPEGNSTSCCDHSDSAKCYPITKIPTYEFEGRKVEPGTCGYSVSENKSNIGNVKHDGLCNKDDVKLGDFTWRGSTTSSKYSKGKCLSSGKIQDEVTPCSIYEKEANPKQLQIKCDGTGGRCKYYKASEEHECNEYETEQNCNDSNGCKWLLNTCAPKSRCIQTRVSQSKPYICCEKGEALKCCLNNYENCNETTCTQDGKEYKCINESLEGSTSCYPDMNLSDMVNCNDIGNKKCVANTTKTGFSCYT
jgi:hypothetical protein